jgi:histidine triad (HIT) family protein
VSCIFCRIVARELPASVVFEDDQLMAFLDIHPWRPGHTLVIPKLHKKLVAELDRETRSRILELGSAIGHALRAAELGCKDVHFVINDGAAANQSVPHVHLHVLPRSGGDFWRLLLGAAKHGIGRVLVPAPRQVLDGHAAAIRSALVTDR